MKRKRFYRFITIGLLSILLVSCAKKAETESVGDKTPVVSAAETLGRVEDLFRQRRDPAKLREAVKLLAASRDIGNRNYEIEWQYARFNYFLGKRSTDDKEIEKAFEDGLQAGKIAARLEPNKPEGHFWYGANLGEQAKKNYLTVGIKAIDEIRATMNRVIEIDPAYQSGSAYVALAQVELKAGLLGGGKSEKAVEYLEKALQISKENPYVHLYLGEAYLAVNRDADAKKQLEYLLKMKPNPEYAVEYEECSEKAKKMLESRF
jgi:tetratricopeptide (TPR) repeat protein